MTDLTEIIQTDIDQIAEIEESHSVAENNVDKITLRTTVWTEL